MTFVMPITRRVLPFALGLTLTACLGRTAQPATLVVELPHTQTTQPDRATAQPTATATATSAPTPSPTPAPLATPGGQIGPSGFAPEINPLTGESVPDSSVLDRRPIAIKVSNFPACVRPQHGLSLADLVFEHYAEGGTTRLTAIFYSHDAPRVGSVRSARLIDLEIPAMYYSAFAFSGASDGVLKRLQGIDFKEWIISPEFEPGHPAFFRVPKETLQGDCQLQEHTLFTSTDRVWADATAKGINNRQAIEGMVFNQQPPSGGQPALSITLPYSATYVRWNYNAEVSRYFRFADGVTHMDGLTGAPITAANVVVVFAHHQTTDIIEDFVGYDPRTGKGGNYSLEIQVWGSGPALVYRDGQVFAATWSRQTRFGPLQFFDTATAQPLVLKPGNTWFQLVNLNSPITQPDAHSWQVVPMRPTLPAP